MTAATAPLAAARAPRAPLPPLSRVAAVSLVAASAMLLYLMAFVFRMFIPPIAVFALFGLGFAAVVARGVRWAPALAALFGVVFLAMNGKYIVDDLSQPASAMFTPVLLAAVAGTLALAAGVGALVRNYRRSHTAAGPRWLTPTLAAVAGACVGAIALSTVARAGATSSAGVSPRVLSSLPAVTTQNFSFAQPELRVKAGQQVALRLENRDDMTHSFDIDELDVHVPMLGKATSLALFTADKPGRYTIYCAPHYDRKSGQGMKTTLVVEP
jgi:cytochrome c oxidase subunit II